MLCFVILYDSEAEKQQLDQDRDSELQCIISGNTTTSLALPDILPAGARSLTSRGAHQPQTAHLALRLDGHEQRHQKLDDAAPSMPKNEGHTT